MSVIASGVSMHAVTAQKKTIVQRHRLRGIVEPDLGLDAKRTIENVGPAGRTLANVVGREQREAIVAKPVGARITDMKHMRNAPAQHQCGKRTTHAVEFCVAPPLRIDPTVERIEDRGRGAAHLHGFGHIAKAVEKTAHGGLGGDAAAFMAADAVRDRGNDIAPRLRQFHAEDRAGEIFVAFARSGL
jgi:hypothetical protein